MSNEHMTVPTPEQENKVKAAVEALDAASKSASDVRAVIGGLRDELNHCRNLLGRLSNAVGENAYPFNATVSWKGEINRRISAIEGMLK